MCGRLVGELETQWEVGSEGGVYGRLGEVGSSCNKESRGTTTTRVSRGSESSRISDCGKKSYVSRLSLLFINSKI